MGATELVCPLCCNETFSSSSALKYHLLSIIANILCPTCHQRFEHIEELAEHLDSPCERAKIKVETLDAIEEDNDVEKSLLAKALMKDMSSEKSTECIVEDTSGEQEIEEQIVDASIRKNEDGEEEVFYCSSCMISFTSLNDHLQEYHEGQTVFIEDGDAETEQKEEEKSFYVVEGKEEADAVDTEDSNDIEIPLDTEYNTIQEEDCIDKDGRLYTRKVVQIDKFWDENTMDVSKKSPAILQYVLENGKAKRADEFNLENLEENQKLLIIYQCPDCSIHFSKMEQYEKHKCNKPTKLYKCEKCEETFTSIKLCNEHMKKHRTERGGHDNQGPFICETCNTEFPSYKSLRLHKRMHDPIKERDIEPPVNYNIMGEGDDNSTETKDREMFLCEICNVTYDKQYEEVHMRSHCEEEKFDCGICNRKFFNQVNLEMHLKVHNNGKKFSCTQCKKTFLTNEALQEHVNSKCADSKKLYECQYCGRRFVRPHEKVKHERIHTGEKPHVCKICKKAFRVSYCLTLHLRTHSGNRPYECGVCGKRFKAHSVYNHHMLIHSNERNYKCPYCPKSFKTGVQLAGHKNSHTKPFNCTECNRPFASLYAVRAHMESHYRENNLKFNCAECGASYARAFALRDHIKAHHPNASIEKSSNEVLLQDYEMVTESMSASNNILPVDENILVQYEQVSAETVELEEGLEEAC